MTAGYSGTPLPKKLGIKEGHRVALGGLWIAWPKKASGMQTDVGEALVREYGVEQGLVDNKICAIETWLGLRFVIRLKDRTS